MLFFLDKEANALRIDKLISLRVYKLTELTYHVEAYFETVTSQFRTVILGTYTNKEEAELRLAILIDHINNAKNEMDILRTLNSFPHNEEESSERRIKVNGGKSLENL